MPHGAARSPVMLTAAGCLFRRGLTQHVHLYPNVPLFKNTETCCIEGGTRTWDTPWKYADCTLETMVSDKKSPSYNACIPGTPLKRDGLTPQRPGIRFPLIHFVKPRSNLFPQGHVFALGDQGTAWELIEPVTGPCSRVCSACHSPECAPSRGLQDKCLAWGPNPLHRDIQVTFLVLLFNRGGHRETTDTWHRATESSCVSTATGPRCTLTPRPISSWTASDSRVPCHTAQRVRLPPP